jgi:hypothetical protein
MKKSAGMIIAITVMAILMGSFITVQSSTAGEKDRDGRFIAYDNGTVLDTKTNLMWAEKDNGSTLNWVLAKSYCESYRGSDYKDWRLPTQDELAGLYDEAITNTTDNGRTAHLTKLIHLASGSIWTSESSVLPHASAVSHADTASIFIFTRGKRFSIRAESAVEVCALPVRSNK